MIQSVLNRLGREGIGGAAVTLIGLLGFWIVRDYPVGDLSEFGVGFMPWVCTVGMAILGAVIVLRALKANNTDEIHPALGRPLMVIVAGMAIFAFALDPLGLFTSAVLSVFVSSLASGESSLRERILVSFGLATLVTLLFGYGLGMSMPLWPWFMRP
jgi:hypothetical protein